MASKIIGIDLGTTNSVVAVVEGGEPIVIANPEGARTTPSVVAFSDKGERLVGQVAKRQAITNPANTIYSIKRFMGRKFDEVQDELKLVPYEVIEGLGGEVRVKVRTQEFAPPEISAMILQKLKSAAEDYLGGPVAEAVITVPAYFNDSQRQATKEAGKIAGLEVRRIINEPTAAALAYGFQKEKTGEELIAVYDLGGGTFDISILERSEGLLEVRSTSGDTHLGGDDLDRVLAGWVLDEFKKEIGIDLALDKMALQRVREAAEKAKIELSSIVESTLNLPFITADAAGPKHLSMTLTRAKLESLCEDLFLRTREPCLQALRDAGVKPEQIAQVLLVGGSTRIPRVQEIVRELFGREPSKNVNPDEVVAVGAAIQGAVMSGEVRDLLLLDVTPLTLGIATHGGVMTPLIQRNTTIPTKKSRTFSTVVDNQESVEIHVLQGERKMSADNKSLGKFQLVDIPKAPRGVPQVEVTFDIDANGIVNVSATDRATGKQQQITVTGAAGLSEGEIERMVHDAEEHSRRDEGLAELAKVRNQAESLIYSVERILREHRKTVPAQIVSRCEEALLAMNGLLDNESVETIRSGLDALGSALNVLHTAVATADAQKQAAETAAAGSPGAEGSAGPSSADQDGATKGEAAGEKTPSGAAEAASGPSGSDAANGNEPSPDGTAQSGSGTDGTSNRDPDA